MKILFFINGIYLGGKERRLVELMKQLKLDDQFEFQLVVMNPEINYHEIFDLDIKVHYLIRKTKRDLTVFRRFYRISKNFKPDIIHCWDGMTAIYSIPTCKLLKIKLLNGMVVDAPLRRSIPNKKWIRAKFLFPFSDLIIANSQAGIEAYKCPTAKSNVIYNGYNFDRNNGLKETEEIRKELEITTKHVVGMVATFSEFKDYKTYYKAAEMVLEKRKDVTFLVVGNNTDCLESENLVSIQNKKYFRFLGKKSNIESIINAMDIGVLATFTEGISNSILEYMALGKPVIATDGGGTKEIVEENKTGYLVNISNATELSNKMQILLNNPRLCYEMGLKGQEKVRNQFAIETMVNQFISSYKYLASNEKKVFQNSQPTSSLIEKIA